MRLLCLTLLVLAACRPAPDAPLLTGTPPFSPEDALRTFELADGFQIEVFAAEPLIADPVAMEVDENGHVFVVEMPGYPLDVNATGRIKQLHDTDGDGRLDRATLFADSLILPTGLMRWKNGLLVTDAPDVLYLEDTDGDGQADHREVLLTGFARSNPQHNFNAPLYGLDNQIHLANNGPIWWTERFAEQFGGRGEEIHFPNRPDGPRLPINGGNRSVSFRPDTYELAMRSGHSQFGHSFDAWGRYFTVGNANHQRHEVLAARYLERNPYLPAALASQTTPAGGTPATIYPITHDPDHQLLTDRGVTTSASGLTFYTGDLFPEPYDHVAFVGESVHNLVHADVVRPDGATFVAEPVLDDQEFLASTDSWFRPVNFYVGPDGALYVIDYYRQIVEHPEWMDDAVAASGQLQNGTEHGRIYRITPTGTPAADWIAQLNLAEAAPTTLVDRLGHANLWWRRTAQRLLLDQRPVDAIALLQDAATSPHPLSQLHALWTLESLGELTPDLLTTTLTDADAGVREHALVLAESRLAESPDLQATALALREDGDARVRFQLLNTLALLDTPKAASVREAIFLAEIDDPWMQFAALAQEPNPDAERFDAVLTQLQDAPSESRAAYLEQFAANVALRGQPSEIAHLTHRATASTDVASAWWRAATLRGLARALDYTRPDPASLSTLRVPLLDGCFDGEQPDVRRARLRVLEHTGLGSTPRLKPYLSQAAALATDGEQPNPLRRDAIAFLGLASPEMHASLFQGLVTPQTPTLIQATAVASLAAVPGEDALANLVDAWPSLSPAVRQAVLDGLMQSPERMTRLIDAVDAGTIDPASLGWDRTVRLMRDTAEPLRSRARALLSERPGTREAAVQTYVAALEPLSGSAEAGAAVFARACSACHQLQNEHGSTYGPDLGTVRHWSPEALVAEILMPQKSIADGYEQWQVTLADGSTESGLLVRESAQALTLRRPGPIDTEVPRRQITSIEGLRISAMPGGLEAQLSHQDMADLIAFIQGR
ncbi:MAG: c-type cytochrome [Rhodothermales bacterium]